MGDKDKFACLEGIEFEALDDKGNADTESLLRDCIAEEFEEMGQEE